MALGCQILYPETHLGSYARIAGRPEFPDGCTRAASIIVRAAPPLPLIHGTQSYHRLEKPS